MKYLAILKDSLREAWDSWVLLGLFVVTTLVILFVGTLSFKPQSAKKTMESFFTPVISITLNNHKPEKHDMGGMPWGRFRVDDVKLLQGEEDSPQGEYLVTVSPRWDAFDGPGPRMAKKEQVGKEPKEPKAAKVDHESNIKQIRKFFEDAEALDYIQVTKVEAIADGEGGTPRYRMNIQGTAKTHRLWATEPGLFFGALSTEEFALPLALVLYALAGNVIGFGSWIAVLLGVIITAFFIPNMLRKGTIDLLLTKPISRPALILNKYLGGLTFIFFTTAYAIGGIWFVLGIRSGLWANGALLLIFTITFFFAILYAVSTFVAVVTRSVVASILITIVAWFGFFVIGKTYTFVDDYQRKQEDRAKVMMNDAPRAEEPEWLRWVIGGIRAAHAVAPRTEDLNRLNSLIVQTDFLSGNLGDMSKFDTSKRNWWECVFVSAGWIAVFLGLASAWFYFKDY